MLSRTILNFSSIQNLKLAELVVLPTLPISITFPLRPKTLTDGINS